MVVSMPDMKSYHDLETFQNECVIIYRRSPSSSQNYQTRIRIPGSTGYVVRSCKTPDRDDAYKFAANLFDELRVKVLAAEDATELHQLYVGETAKGTGVAAALIEWGIAWARERASILYLSVFGENRRAQAFYRRYGFADVGRNAFRVGNHIDEDRIWRLDL